MRDFDETRTNAIVIVNTQSGLRRCIDAILQGTIKEVDAEDLHVYVSRKIPQHVVDEQVNRTMPAAGEQGVVEGYIDETQLDAEFAKRKTPGKPRLMIYAGASRATLRSICKQLAKHVDVPARRLMKADWASVKFL